MDIRTMIPSQKSITMIWLLSLAVGIAACGGSDGGGNIGVIEEKAPGDVITGGAQLNEGGTGFPATVIFHAHSNADGSNARGKLKIFEADAVLLGDVECMSVDGDRGVAGGKIVQATGVFARWLGRTFYQVVQDNGQGQDPNDAGVAYLLFSEPNSAVCEFAAQRPDIYPPIFTVDRGNYNVIDR